MYCSVLFLKLNVLVMFTVLFLLFIGIGIGYVFRRVTFLYQVEKNVSYTVLLMLFVFGSSHGSNDELVSN